jgi:hypothetical protein
MKIAIYKEKETFQKLKTDGGLFDRISKINSLKGYKRRSGESDLIEIYMFDGIETDSQSVANLRAVFTVVVFEVKDFKRY